ncbi:MAG: transposase [Jaaginema sp. PMC 1079.18]|nr:transposase [Jaaginema sp. PMC 1080.18]MEC4851674.1 transposase [Jaaginema sp. PMC 1079.18]MEC4868096.1 transposase [Jaaginema sp. PMC 1078.18]
MNPPKADYDNPWKEALALYFQPFIAFLFPLIHDNINWERGYEFLDTELQQIVREAEIGFREADKLVKVWRNDGQETWILIHIEIQSQPQSQFAERMYVYNNRIFDRYRRPVVSLAILADEQASWRPQQFSYDLWGCRVSLEFPTVKLLDYDPETLSQNQNVFAPIIAAHLETQKTRANPQQRYQAKLNLIKGLYRRGLGRQDILELFRLIDWIMALPEHQQTNFRQEIQRFEEKNRMPYVTSIERFALARGESRGALLNSRESVLEVLQVRFEEVPEAIAEAVNQIEDLEVLKGLLRQAITVATLADFQALLPPQAQEGNSSES